MMPYDASELIKSYRVDGFPLYFVGTFDSGVTVFSQQIRALNFAWAAIESRLVPATTAANPSSTEPRFQIAIVGAGFTGLTVAAGLLVKGVRAGITLFEQRDTLLPLQQGSDSRWLHPRIYDWPKTGSREGVAKLPLLNWYAARASDVVARVLTEWGVLLTKPRKELLTLYCNTRHLQIDKGIGSTGRLKIEWIGESRDPSDGTIKDEIAATGKSVEFDLVILAVGFGIERNGTLSYWRNETIGQPSLDQQRRTFLVSGQGDSAMIDLLRLRISHYRQDWILDEIFTKHKKLMAAIKKLHNKYGKDPFPTGLFADLERLASNKTTKDDFDIVHQKLSRRLRRDTDAILQLKEKDISKLFEPGKSRISFQNKLLVFFLYKCGGFVPSSLTEDMLVQQYGIQPANIIRRHGTQREDHLKNMLSNDLYKAIEKVVPCTCSQVDEPRWRGGYFDSPGHSKDIHKVSEKQRSNWRKEYLPGPTELLATAFCSALSGAILTQYLPEYSESGRYRLRVTLHRVMVFGSEELLQQACDYQGTTNARGEKSAAGRTFPARNATIGVAYRCRRIVRSVRRVTTKKLSSAMEKLNLNEASRTMSSKVYFILAIPLLVGARGKHRSAVLGVIYVDSTDPKFFIDDNKLKLISRIGESFLKAMDRVSCSPVDRIWNIPFAESDYNTRTAEPLPEDVRGILNLVEDVEPPWFDKLLQLNYDYTDSLSEQGN